MTAACPSCGTEAPVEGARFCHACGTPFAAACGGCGAELVPGARFCSSCGAPQDTAGAAPAEPAVPRPESERRTVSILFGDLVGYTSRAEGMDQEDARELLSQFFEGCRQIVQRYGGTIEKFIGDAVMAVWGVPTAHEDDAERAVRAGLELVRMVGDLIGDDGASLSMRVGIVTGEVAATLGAAD